VHACLLVVSRSFIACLFPFPSLRSVIKVSTCMFRCSSGDARLVHPVPRSSPERRDRFDPLIISTLGRILPPPLLRRASAGCGLRITECGEHASLPRWNERGSRKTTRMRWPQTIGAQVSWSRMSACYSYQPQIPLRLPPRSIESRHSGRVPPRCTHSHTVIL